MGVEPTVIVSWRAPVVTLTLSRPTSHNAFNLQMRDELAEVLAMLPSLADDHRVVVLQGAGRNFCAGADLREFGNVESLSGARETRRLRDVFQMLRDLPQITIASLHGHVIGSGLEMALECDLRFASESACLCLPETRLGLIPAAGATQTFSRVAGRGRALDLVLTGRQMSAREALRCGAVSRVYADDSCRDAVAFAAGAIGATDTPLRVKQVLAGRIEQAGEAWG